MNRSQDNPIASDEDRRSEDAHTSAENRDGAVAQGEKNTALGQGAVQVGKKVGGDVVTGIKETTTNTTNNIFQGNPVTMIGIIAIVAIVAITLAVLWMRVPPPNGHATPATSSMAISTSPPLTPTLPPTLTEPALTATPPPPACYAQGENDEATLRQLIQLESDALATEKLSIISGIFAPDALIGDAVRKEYWRDPRTRYQGYFDSILSAQITRTGVQPVARGLLEDAAWFTSGDLTRLTWLDGAEVTYENEPGSTHWTFAKDSLGCWQITSLIFNAGHIHFPCYCPQTDDAESLSCLINAESQAVREENPLLIWAIFAPNASIQDGNVPLANNPLDFYSVARFAKFDYSDPQHVDITKILITGDQAIYTSGSQGSYRDATGNTLPYDNPNPADRWQFQRNAAGCWVIASFAFNQK